MKNDNRQYREIILKDYFSKNIPKSEFLKYYDIDANTLDFWISEHERSDRNKSKTEKNFSVYQSEADHEFHIFLKEEPFLLDMPHYHESVEMIFMLKGSALAHIGENTCLIKKGEICFSNTLQNHFYENQSNDLQAICLVLSHAFTHHYRQQFKDKTPPPFMRDPEKNKRLIQIVQKWLGEKRKTFLLNCAYSNYLFDAIEETYGFNKTPKSNGDRAAIEFIDYIKDNLSSDISLTSMAKHFGYTKEYCSELFNKAVGQHFTTFVNNVRTQKAVELMNDPQNADRKITDIVYECGFKSQVTFYRYYKKYKNKMSDAEKRGQ